MINHEYKILPIFFKQKLRGGKRYEIRKIRKGDPQVSVGDSLTLREFKDGYTGREMVVKVDSILHGNHWGIVENFHIIGHGSIMKKVTWLNIILSKLKKW
jgi:hypothetical protein